MDSGHIPRDAFSDPSAAVPDTYFDRQWAMALMDRGLETVRCSLEKAGKANYFDVLKPWLVGETGSLSQADAVAELGISAGAVKVAVHRLRQNFRDAIQSEIAQTVNNPEEVADELRYLIEVLASQLP